MSNGPGHKDRHAVSYINGYEPPVAREKFWWPFALSFGPGVIMNRALILLVLPILFWTAPALAQCAVPSGSEGEIIYNSSYNVHQYCNGTAWVAFGALNPGAGGSGCGVPTGGEGELLYNSAYHMLQYCDGDDWRAVGGALSATLSGPAGCTAVGDLCANGTVFAGYHPLTLEHLFIPPTDQGTTSLWKTSTGVDDIATDSYSDGRVNTNQVANSATFPAFKLCKDLALGGKTWYLPSQVEMYYVWSARSILMAKGNITNFQNLYYWTSMEAGLSSAWYQDFTDGYQNSHGKGNSNRVRCMAR